MAKANIFLKITGKDEARRLHTLASRFVLLPQLFDELFFVPVSEEAEGDFYEFARDDFRILTNFKEEKNIIFSAYEALIEAGFEKKLKQFFQKYKLKLIKKIPRCAGLGGGSSDCAAFLKMINEELKMDEAKLFKIGLGLGSDLGFFLSGFSFANVSGWGEKIEEFEDEPVSLEWIFPSDENYKNEKIFCETRRVFEEFKKYDFDLEKNKILGENFLKLSSEEILKNHKNVELNDLFHPCVNAYPGMRIFLDEGYFLSGSGSSIFKPK